MSHEINSPSSDEQSIDAICGLLSDDRRRFAVSVLSECESSMAVTDLARDVAAWETGTEPADVPDEQVEEFAVSLHHTHLPKLADYDVVAYDAETKTVRADRIESLSRHVPEPEN